MASHYGVAVEHPVGDNTLARGHVDRHRISLLAALRGKELQQLRPEHIAAGSHDGVAHLRYPPCDVATLPLRVNKSYRLHFSIFI